MLIGDDKELFIEFRGSLNRLYHLDLKYEDKKESNRAFYVAAQHHICGTDSLTSIMQPLGVPEYYIGLGEYKTSGVFEQAEKDLADLGVTFFCGTAERPNDAGTQGAWGPL